MVSNNNNDNDNNLKEQKGFHRGTIGTADLLYNDQLQEDQSNAKM